MFEVIYKQWHHCIFLFLLLSTIFVSHLSDFFLTMKYLHWFQPQKSRICGAVIFSDSMTKRFSKKAYIHFNQLDKIQAIQLHIKLSITAFVPSTWFSEWDRHLVVVWNQLVFTDSSAQCCCWVSCLLTSPPCAITITAWCPLNHTSETSPT